MYHLLLNHVILPLTLSCTSSRYLRLARQSSQRQYWPSDRLNAFQLQLLNDSLADAKRHIPYYRDRFQNLPDRLDSLAGLAEFPQLTKNDVSANFPDRIVSEAIDKQEIRWRGTGGTTQRIVVADDFVKRDYMRAASRQAYTEDCDYRQGRRAVMIPPDACSQLCATDGMRETTVLRHLVKMIYERKLADEESRSDLRGLVMSNWIECQTILEPFGPDGTHISDDRLATYVARVREVRPFLLKALPEYLLGLARYAKSSGEALPRVPVIKPMGALMTPAMKCRVAEAFGSRVREDYGCNDLGPLGFECSRGALHLLADHLYFEFDCGGRPAGDGELASILVTDLNNRAMPLIRYRLGDLVRVDRSPCACGRLTPRVVIEGREEDAVGGPAGKAMTPRAVCEFFFGRPDIEAFQLVERSEKRFELKYVTANPDFPTDRLRDDFQSHFDDRRTLQMRAVQSILPEVSGKFRLLKSRSHSAVASGAAAAAAPRQASLSIQDGYDAGE